MPTREFSHGNLFIPLGKTTFPWRFSLSWYLFFSYPTKKVGLSVCSHSIMVCVTFCSPHTHTHEKDEKVKNKTICSGPIKGRIKELFVICPFVLVYPPMSLCLPYVFPMSSLCPYVCPTSAFPLSFTTPLLLPPFSVQQIRTSRGLLYLCEWSPSIQPSAVRPPFPWSSDTTLFIYLSAFVSSSQSFCIWAMGQWVIGEWAVDNEQWAKGDGWKILHNPHYTQTQAQIQAQTPTNKRTNKLTNKQTLHSLFYTFIPSYPATFSCSHPPTTLREVWCSVTKPRESQRVAQYVCVCVCVCACVSYGIFFTNKHVQVWFFFVGRRARGRSMLSFSRYRSLILFFLPSMGGLACSIGWSSHHPLHRARVDWSLRAPFCFLMVTPY